MLIIFYREWAPLTITNENLLNTHGVSQKSKYLYFLFIKDDEMSADILPVTDPGLSVALKFCAGKEVTLRIASSNVITFSSLTYFASTFALVPYIPGDAASHIQWLRMEASLANILKGYCMMRLISSSLMP
ncbi:MAG: hypothetical protein IPQ06_15580 [Chitinophagaceae bacterium]|nr:hypothetical protein [Chitinophagaceae bacterium]